MLALALALMAPPADLFTRPNLVAWCVVPFDGKKRSPEDRAAMLAGLGFKKYAYDWRAEHLPTLDREVAALAKHNVELTAVWFPPVLNADAKTILAALAKHKLTPQLWVSPIQPPETGDKVAAVAEQFRPVVAAAVAQGCKVGVYNHGGWAGEPENMVAVVKKLDSPHVGIVYNLHHGHDHLDRLPAALAAMKPHLLCLNLNGMTVAGDKKGQKILVLGHGDDDAALLDGIAKSGYAGPVGILGHTQDDAADRLSDNLAGLDWLRGGKTGTRPTPKTKVGQ
jgi:hypothetical protein